MKILDVKIVRYKLREEKWGKGSTIIHMICITTVIILLLINEKAEKFDILYTIHHFTISVHGPDISS